MRVVRSQLVERAVELLMALAMLFFGQFRCAFRQASTRLALACWFRSLSFKYGSASLDKNFMAALPFL
jgi:hypothetical protein